MSRENETQTSQFDTFKWIIVFLFIFGGIIANSYFDDVALALRAAAGVILLIAALFTASRTAKGQLAWSFMKGARNEMRKVVWPTRHETTQTTLIVVAMVVVAALILWGIDRIFFELVAWLTGQG
ncbi:MAG: preprotein translocase subunit SecE [Gammaproteobacteria bacterium RIFCSPLOWO2_02_FULL_42_14]|nr:MAG: preprotein translocase subunit SecE [Gammaproteobacteria bacterium RIFCSPHIGHO2_02_FULL_42_43]OGT62378.1 MAG: preprotein translocase subunit SecE [Gammaproteobacteria bacterium RIFCSPLOWO2_02_FULL_42_14]OGT86151.1 MAG: preprotein translocase subunit SecE [Gammaproteobacteria bacterium RIFCSPLOWO2_12_FULL_42_18]